MILAERDCYACDGAAVSDCGRCARPVCRDHAHDDRRRCPNCEWAFAQRDSAQNTQHRNVVAYTSAALPSFIVAVLVSVPVGVLGYAAGIAVIQAGRAVLRRRGRDRFLNERLLPEVPAAKALPQK